MSQLNFKSFFDCQTQENDMLQNHLQYLIQNQLPIFTFSTIQFEEESEESSNKKQSEEERVNDLRERILNYNRKSKSLQELSKKFIDFFQGRNNNNIELDKVTIQLGVQRRRIYDIINILQSLQVVRKKGKNNYWWKGLSEAVKTINQCKKEGESFKIENLKKEKSLEYLACGFLKIFLLSKPAISLEEAAKQMMKTSDDAAIKTKIRRLYDIINVFKSLGLVKKITLDNRKPGFQWAGTQFLQNLIIQKQSEGQENTNLAEQSQKIAFEDKQNVSTSSNKIFFSPMIFPVPKKTETAIQVQNSKFSESGFLFSLQNSIQKSNQQTGLMPKDPDFLIFRKTCSAFSLVAERKCKDQ